MKKRIWYILIIILILTLALVVSFAVNQIKLLTPEESCVQSGGAWETFPDTCANLCFYERGGARNCAEVLTDSCNCLAGDCWDGKSCVPI
jgi:hypothetical protein